jgi:hypothetical protein
MTVTDVGGRVVGGNGDDEGVVLGLCRQLLEELPPRETEAAAFLGRQFDLGLAWVNFPEGQGGLGLSPSCSG